MPQFEFKSEIQCRLPLNLREAIFRVLALKDNNNFMRNEKGQFVKTNGKTRYRCVQRKGKRMGESRAVWIEKVGEIPEGFIVHHIDGNKKNNDINNLALMTYTGHNKLHSPDREIWNKGISVKTNKKWKETIELAQKRRREHFLPIFKETYEMRMKGISVVDISKELGVCGRSIYDRIKVYEKYLEQQKTTP